MTIITPTKAPVYWAVDIPEAVTGITYVGEQTLSGKTIIYDAEPAVFLTKISALKVTKSVPESVGSVYKDTSGKLCVVEIAKVEAVPIDEKPIDEVPVTEIKVIK